MNVFNNALKRMHLLKRLFRFWIKYILIVINATVFQAFNQFCIYE